MNNDVKNFVWVEVKESDDAGDSVPKFGVSTSGLTAHKCMKFTQKLRISLTLFTQQIVLVLSVEFDGAMPNIGTAKLV